MSLELEQSLSMCIKVCLANLRVISEVYGGETVRCSIWGYTSPWEKEKMHRVRKQKCYTTRMNLKAGAKSSSGHSSVSSWQTNTHHEDHEETKEKSHFTLPMLNVVRLNVLNLKAFMKPQGEHVQINTLELVVRCIWCNMESSGGQKSEKTLKVWDSKMSINLLIKVKA